MSWNYQTKSRNVSASVAALWKHRWTIVLIFLVLLILNKIHFDAFHPWDFLPSRASLSLDTDSEDISDLAFSPDGKLASSGLDGRVTMWDLDNRKIVLNFRGSSELVSSI